jgi:hypothetical protein
LGAFDVTSLPAFVFDRNAYQKTTRGMQMSSKRSIKQAAQARGVAPRQLVIETINRLNDMQAAADDLDVSRQALYSYVKRNNITVTRKSCLKAEG